MLKAAPDQILIPKNVRLGAQSGSPLFILFLVIGLICAYAAALNTLYYGQFGPFYDSLAYFNQLATTQRIVNDNGLGAALSSLFNRSTVMLPWLEGIVIAPWVETGRTLAVWIQAPWLFLLAYMGYEYFQRVVRYPADRSVLSAILLCSFSAVYGFNGGLSDFRMDLLQALTFGASSCAYLIARREEGYRWWLVFGLVAGASCLARATTPVYLVLVFGPLFISDVVLAGAKREIVFRYLLAGATASVVGGWFFFLNREYLHYYYLVWNVDAYANLKLRESINHLFFSLDRIGQPILIFALLSFVSALVLTPLRLTSINGAALWTGVAPLLYLIGSGAGLNPFVCLIAVPGLLLFALAPFQASETVQNDKQPFWSWRRRLQRPINSLVMTCGAIVIVWTAYSGIAQHTSRVPIYMPREMALRQITDRMITDAKAEGRTRIQFQVGYVSGLVSDAIINYLVYDKKFGLKPNGCAVGDMIGITALPVDFAQPVEWAAIPGATAAEKVAEIASEIIAKADYVLLSLPGSFLPAHVPISAHTSDLEAALKSRVNLRPLGPPILVSPVEQVQLYRNPSAQTTPPC